MSKLIFALEYQADIAISDCKIVLNVEFLVAVLVLINSNIQHTKNVSKMKILIFPSMLLGL